MTCRHPSVKGELIAKVHFSTLDAYRPRDVWQGTFIRRLDAGKLEVYTVKRKRRKEADAEPGHSQS